MTDIYYDKQGQRCARLRRERLVSIGAFYSWRDLKIERCPVGWVASGYLASFVAPTLAALRRKLAWKEG